MTSLAAQLNELRLAQRDEIQLPTRTRVSFLFDIKQAANIDDQTLYFMCQASLKHLPAEIGAYAAIGDILHEKSLEFYRGTHTREELKPLDDRLESLIRLLAPHLIDQHAHKVFEYLMRIYEVQVFHKQSVLLAFLPYFETAFFLKALQCLNFKDDQVFGFFDQYSYQGKAIDRTTLVRCLGHNSGQAFIKYAEFVFSMLETIDTSLNNLHWKFFGTMLIEVLLKTITYPQIKLYESSLSRPEQKKNSPACHLTRHDTVQVNFDAQLKRAETETSLDFSQSFQQVNQIAIRSDAGNHTLMFNVLPYVSKSLRQQQVRDLKVAGLFAIGQICCRKSLSAEYTKAFFQQVIQTVGDSSSSFQFDEDLKLKGMTVILLIAQHQQHALPSLDSPDLLSFFKVPRVTKLIHLLSQQFDTSMLACLVFRSLLASELAGVKEGTDVIGSLLDDNLQATFAVTQLLISHGLQQAGQDARVRPLLNLVKDHAKDAFQQSCIFSLKQLNDDPALKEKALSLLSEHTASKSSNSNLITTFGDKEYTLLSALGSNRQQTRINALQALNAGNFVEELSTNERDLVKLVLLQLINQEANDEERLKLMLAGLEHIIRVERADQHDNEFDCLEALQTSVATKRLAYTPAILQTIQTLLVKVKVNKLENQQKQALISITRQLNGSALPMPAGNKYSCFNYQGQTKKAVDHMASQMLQKPQLTIQLLTAAFEHPYEYLAFNTLATLMKRLITDTKDDLLQSTFIRDLYPPILRSLKRHHMPHSQDLLLTIIGGIPKLGPKADMHTKKCVSKVYGAAIYQKQLSSTHAAMFDFAQVLSKLQSEVFASTTVFAEFLVSTTMHSSNELKRYFASMHLTSMHEQVAANKGGFCVNFEVMVGALLVMYNDQSTVMRTQAAKLATAYKSAFSSLQPGSTNIYIDAFANTQKPTSTRKPSKDKDDVKGKATPLLDTSALALISDLIKYSVELVNDRQQLQSVLSRHKKPEVFDKILKTLLDYPSFILKAKLLEALQQNSKHTLALSVTLSTLLNKIFAQLDQQTALGEDQLEYLVQVGRLIKCLYTSAEGMQQQLMVSLIFPFLRFCCDHDELFSREKAPFARLSTGAMEMMEAIMIKQSVHKIEEGDFLELARLYAELQSTLLKRHKNSLKTLFVERASELFTQSQLAAAVTDIGTKVKREELSFEDLDFWIESLLQISKPSDKLNSVSLQLLESLIKLFVEKKQDIAYSIELVAQLVQQTQQQTKDTTKTIERLSKLATTAWECVRKAVKTELGKEATTLDPFEAFMKGDDGDVDMDEEHNDSLMSTFQVFLCLLNALAVNEVESMAETHKHLCLVSQLLQSVARIRNAKQSSIQKAIASQLYYLYNSIVIKTSVLHSREFSFKDSLQVYLATAVSLMAGEFASFIGDSQPVLAVVAQAGLEYSPLACLILLAMAASENQAAFETSEGASKADRSSPAIYLAFKIFRNCLVQQNSLECLESFVFMLQHIPIHASSAAFATEKISLIFSDEREGQASCSRWLYSELLQKKDGNVRKFAYLSLFLLQQWLDNCVPILSQIAGSEDANETIQTQFMNTFLATFVLKETFSHTLNSTAKLVGKDDKKTHKSLVRLAKLNDQLQIALNQMLSLHIHVNIVLKILDFTNGPESKKNSTALLPLKTNSVQLLVEKITSFQQGFLANASSQIQSAFRKLVVKAISLLKDNIGLSADNKHESSQFSQCLLILLSRTACGKTFSDKIQQDTLAVVQDYFKAIGSGCSQLQLQTQLVSTEMTLFEVYAFSILEHLQTFFAHVSDGFTKIASVNSDQMIFADTYKFSLLKASVTIAQLFLKFLTVAQLEQLIAKVILAADFSKDRRDSDLVAVVLDSISKEAKSHPKLLVQAVFNAYSRVVTEQDSASKLNNYGFRYFGQLVRPMLAALPKEFISEHSKKLLKFLKQTLTLPYATVQQGFTISAEIEDLLVQCVQAFIIKLTEEQLRPFILSIVKWSMKVNAKTGGFNIYKASMLCQVLIGVLHALREFFVPLIGLYFEPVILEVLKHTSEALASAKQKKKRLHHQTLESEDFPIQANAKLAIGICDVVRLSFKYDASSFIQADTFEKLCDPVASMLTCTGLCETDFEHFVSQTVRDMVVEMNERINDDACWIKLNLALLMHTRSEQWQTRLGALTIVEHLFDVMRERYLIVLNDTIPFISELLEDENETVEGVAKRIVNRIEQLTGESINEYLK